MGASHEDCSVFVFDFDGVLAASTEGGRIVAREAGISALREALGVGTVYVLSGRVSQEKWIIKALLSQEGLYRGVKVVTRRPGDKRSEVDYKLSELLRILEVEGCIGEIHDNNPYVLEAARRHVLRGGILHYDNTCEPLYGFTVLEACRAF